MRSPRSMPTLAPAKTRSPNPSVGYMESVVTRNAPPLIIIARGMLQISSAPTPVRANSFIERRSATRDSASTEIWTQNIISNDRMRESDESDLHKVQSSRVLTTPTARCAASPPLQGGECPDSKFIHVSNLGRSDSPP